jgi:glycosyltransferase involved in cell wall biosynthesis
MDPGERRLIGEVDQVIIHSPRLMERKGSINPHTTVIPNGVDYRLYSSPMPEPSDLARIPHPRIGYTGNLKTQLDWPLLKNLAVGHPQWSFVFVGPRRFLTAPDRAKLDEMANLPNVYFLGGKTVKELAVYPQHFDVCIMPYVVNGYTQNIYPMKLHEYLASGRPVVGSAIRSLEDFDQVIALARTDAEWSGAITRALASALSTLEAAAARRAVAQKYDWSELTYRIVQTICERLNPALLGQVEKLTIDTPGFDFPAESSREPQSPKPATAVTM